MNWTEQKYHKYGDVASATMFTSPDQYIDLPRWNFLCRQDHSYLCHISIIIFIRTEVGTE